MIYSRMDDLTIEEEIKEILEETTKWSKLFESFWDVKILLYIYIVLFSIYYYIHDKFNEKF